MNIRFAHHKRAGPVVSYALDRKKSPQLVAGTLTGLDPPELIRELEVFARGRPGIAKPIVHIIVAFAPGDRERLRNGELEELLDELTARAGYGRTAWVAVEHFDGGVRHLSIVASGVDASGQRIATHWEGASVRPIVEMLEAKYGLVATGRGDNLRRAPNKDQIERDRRLGRRSLVDQLRRKIDVAVERARRLGGSMIAFAAALRRRGVELEPRVANGEVQGIAYQWRRAGPATDMWASGTQLGRGYTWPGLQRDRGLTYEPTRDSVALLRTPEATNLRAYRAAREDVPAMEPSAIAHTIPPAAVSSSVAVDGTIPPEGPPIVSAGFDSAVTGPYEAVVAALETMEQQARLHPRRQSLLQELEDSITAHRPPEEILRDPLARLHGAFDAMYQDPDSALSRVGSKVVGMRGKVDVDHVDAWLALPHQIGPLRRRKRWPVGERLPSPEEIGEWARATAPRLMEEIKQIRRLLALQETHRKPDVIRAELADVDRRIACSGDAVRYGAVRDLLAAANLDLGQWETLRTRFPSAMRTAEQKLFPSLQKGGR